MFVHDKNSKPILPLHLMVALTLELTVLITRFAAEVMEKIVLTLLVTLCIPGHRSMVTFETFKCSTVLFSSSVKW